MFGLSGLFSGDAAGGGFLGGLLGPRFSCELKCYPVSFIGREDLEAGNRLVMPPAALQRLQELGAPSPMMFEVSDLEGRRHTHAGVLEFVAPEETCYMPYWIMRQLQAEEGDVLRLVLKQLPKAKFVRFRPASVALHRVYDPKALLECGLRNYVALTIGDSFAVESNGQKYGLEVMELQPAEAASIIDTDLEVEFATPKDAEAAASRATSRQSEGVASRATSRQSEEGEDDISTLGGSGAGRKAAKIFSGAGRRIDGAIVMPKGEDSDESEEFDEIPWKRRVPGGVKWTSPPFGVDLARITGEAPMGHLATSSTAAASTSSTAPGGVSVVTQVISVPQEAPDAAATAESRARALEAAEVRYAQHAEEIEQRRREEEEEKAQQQVRMEEEERRRQAAEERKRAAAEARQQAAPAQQQMVARKGGQGAGGAQKPPRGEAAGACCCGCFRRSDPSPAATRL